MECTYAFGAVIMTAWSARSSHSAGGHQTLFKGQDCPSSCCIVIVDDMAAHPIATPVGPPLEFLQCREHRMSKPLVQRLVDVVLQGSSRHVTCRQRNLRRLPSLVKAQGSAPRPKAVGCASMPRRTTMWRTSSPRRMSKSESSRTMPPGAQSELATETKMTRSPA